MFYFNGGNNMVILVKEGNTYNTIIDYFEADDNEMTFDDETYIRDARDKANAIIDFK